jgi:hypothetical protein
MSPKIPQSFTKHVTLKKKRKKDENIPEGVFSISDAIFESVFQTILDHE